MSDIDEVIEHCTERKGQWERKGEANLPNGLAMASVYEVLRYSLKYIQCLEKRIEDMEKEKS